MKKRKIGIFLILIGIAIPSVMFFFVEHELFSIRNNTKVSRQLTPAEFKIIRKEYQMLLDWRAIREKRTNKKPQEKPSFGEFLDEKLGTTKIGGEFSEKDKWINKEWIVENSKIINIPYRIFLGIGVLLSFIGIGFITFSFFPKTKE